MHHSLAGGSVGCGGESRIEAAKRWRGARQHRRLPGFERGPIGALALGLLCGMLSASVAVGQVDSERGHKDSVRSMKLKHAVASAVAQTLVEQFDVARISANDSINRIYLRTTDQTWAEIIRFVDEVEQDTLQHQVWLEEQQQASEREAANDTLRIFQTRYVGGPDLLVVLQQLGLNHEATLSLHPNGRGIIARGAPEAIGTLEALLANLDQPSPDLPPAIGNPLLPEGTSLNGALGQSVEAVESEWLPQGSGLGAPAQLPGARTQGETVEKLRAQYNRSQEDTAEVAQKLAAAEDPRSDEAVQWRAKLEKLVREEFDARQRLQSAEVEQQQAKLTALRGRIERRAKIAEQIIQHRLQELVGNTGQTDQPAGASPGKARNAPSGK